MITPNTSRPVQPGKPNQGPQRPLRALVAVGGMEDADPVTRLWDRIRVGGGVGLITATGMAVFVVLVYIAVVLGGGALLGRTGSPSVWLSVLATAIVAPLPELFSVSVLVPLPLSV